MIWLRPMLAGFAGLALALADPAVAGVPASPRLLVVLTTPDHQTQFMAVTLVAASGIEPADVRILLCGPAGDTVLREPPNGPAPRFGPSAATVQSRLTSLAASGATLEVCAVYLPSRGLDQSALIEDVGVANPAVIGPLLVAPAVRVLTF